MFDFTVILFVGLIALLFGLVIGYLFGGDRRSKTEQGGEHTKIAPKPGLRPLVTVWGDRSSGAVVPEIGEHLYFSPEGLDDPAREQLVYSLERMLTWLAESKPAASPEDAPQAAEYKTEAVVEAGPEAEAVEVPEKLTDGQPTAPAGGINPASLLSRALQTEVRKPKRALSIVEQIDEVLQERLDESPLASRGIRLQESPDHGLVVQVGLSKYQSIDDVPDLEVRDFIRAAVAEWEKRASGA